MATLSDLYTHLKTLCEQWFYNKSQMDTSLGGKVDKITGKGLSTNDYTTAEKNKLSGIEAQANKTVVDSALSGSSENPVQNKAINTALGNKVDKVSGKGLSTNDFTSAYKTKLDNLDTNLSSKNVTVEKLTTAEGDSLSSYVVKQNGVQVGATINIPKDYLIKSGSVKTVTVADQPVPGYIVGDKYLDLVINTKTSDGTDEHIYILVSDLVDSSIDWSNITGKPFDTVDSSWVTDSTNPIQSKLIRSALNGKANSSHNHTISFASETAQISVILTNGGTPVDLGTFIKNNLASKTHNHGNILNGGTITTTGTSGGNIVVTNSSNEVVVDTTINVMDALLQSLITYGSS